MKKFTLLIILAVISIALVYSCKKDIKQLFNKNDIDWAKTYYQNTLQKSQSYKLNSIASASKVTSENNNKLGNEKKPNWAQAKVGISPYYDFVEIPITYTHKISHTFGITNNPNTKPVVNQKIIDASYDRLVIYKDKRGKINQRIISFVPDEEYLSKHKNNISHNSINKLDADFVGYLYYKDWNGKALFVLRIEQGRPIKKYNMLKSITGQIADLNSSKISGAKLMVVDDGGGNTESCYFMTWDWYQDCYYATPESEFPYFCDPVVIYNVQYLEVPCPNTGGGGGGGPSNDPSECLGILIFETGECIVDPISPPSHPLDSILKDTCLNTTQMATLKTMFSDYLSGQGDNDLKCAQMAVYKKFLASGKKIGVCIDQTIDGNGIYKPGSATIFYKYEGGIPVVALFGHEFFHGFQDSFYTGGISQYNTGTRTGYPNIEFEQALFYDIINGSGSADAMGSAAPDIVKTSYQNWINTITNNNTTYPKQLADFGGQYYYFLNLFHLHSPYANIGTVHNNLQPSALLYIFNSSNCK